MAKDVRPALTPARSRLRWEQRRQRLPGVTITINTATSRAQLDELYPHFVDASHGQGGALVLVTAWRPATGEFECTTSVGWTMSPPTPPCRRLPADASPGCAADQLWICEHPPVYTQGLSSKAEHLLMPGNIPVVQTSRGGQVTYHGPGRVVLIHHRPPARGLLREETVYRIRSRDPYAAAPGRFQPPPRYRGAGICMCAWTIPRAHAPLPQRPQKVLAPHPTSTAWARLPRSASRSAATAHTTACRSTWPWIWNPSCVSTHVGIRDCKRWTFLQSACRCPGRTFADILSTKLTSHSP